MIGTCFYCCSVDYKKEEILYITWHVGMWQLAMNKEFKTYGPRNK
jgi:hypothetical protein